MSGAHEISLDEFDHRKEFLKPEPVWDMISMPLYNKDTEKTTQMGSQLAKTVKEQVFKLLRKNRDVFTWSVADMPRIPFTAINHRLDVDPGQSRCNRRRESTPRTSFPG